MAYGEDDQGARVRAAREYAGMNQEQLGRALGGTRKLIAPIEADGQELTIPQARTIAKVTGVPLSFLIDGWIAPPDLIERVAALEEEARRSVADRDRTASEIQALSEMIERRFAELAAQELRQGGRRRRGEDPPRAAG